MSVSEIWTLDRQRLEAYFNSLPGFAPWGEGRWQGENCLVVLESLPERALGPLRLPQTRLEFLGEAAETVYAAFRLRFLSAGG